MSIFHSYLSSCAHFFICREESEILLDFDQFQEFNNILVDQYETIVDKAPVSWKDDGFLIDNVPVGITCWYGQDACVCVSRVAEAVAFEKEHCWEHVRSLDVALATDIRLVPSILLSMLDCLLM